MRGLALAAVVTTLVLASNVFAAEDCSKCACTSYPVEKRCETCCILGNATAVLNTLLDKPNGIPRSLLDKAACVLVYPGVRKIGVGLGVGSGKGVLVCRTGKTMDRNWGAPVMYTLDTGSLGAQVGTTSTDYVRLVMTQNGADKVLSGKVKLGSDASAAAGPSGARLSASTIPESIS